MKWLWIFLSIILVGFVQAEEVVLRADADVDIRSASSADFGFNQDTLMVCHNGDTASRTSGKAYIRFKLPENYGPITRATFTIHRAALGMYGARYEVHGLKDGESELAWVEDDGNKMNWKSAPGNILESPFEFTDAVFLRSFKTWKETEGGEVGDRWSISGPALVHFLNQDSNGYITLLIGRTQQSSSYDKWASKEHAAIHGPTLVLNNTPLHTQSIAMAKPTTTASKRWHAWRTSRKEFPLAAWSYFYRYPGSKEEFQLYKDAGLNFVQAEEFQAANARAAGLGFVLGAFRDVHEDMDQLAALVQFANENPEGAVAYSLKDEPVPSDYDNLGRCMAYIYANDTSGALPIIDFRPNWAVPYTRWKMTYETCFGRFVDEVDPPVLLNCHYPLMRDGRDRSGYYANMEYFRRLALRNNIGLMGFVQLTAHTFENNAEIDYRTPSESDLNWLVNSHLAYGAQGLWYYNWRIRDKRFSEGLVEGESGAPTELYPMVQKVNARVHVLGETLLKLKSQVVVHTDEEVPAGTARYAEGMIKGVYDLEGDSFIVSQFYNQDDLADQAVYLMIVNKSHAADTASDELVQSVAFSIYPDYRKIEFFDFKNLEFRALDLSEDRVSLSLGGGDAAFLVLDRF